MKYTNRFMTTGQISQLVGASPRTVGIWIDTGKLRGYRLPCGSRDRRVPREEVIRFMNDNGIPLPSEMKETVNEQ